MARAKKNALLDKTAAVTREIELASGAGSVLVRGLTRKEALRVREDGLTEEQAECKLLALALVDPQMSEEDAAAWQENSPAGDIGPVVDAALVLSGMKTEAPREAAAAFRE